MRPDYRGNLIHLHWCKSRYLLQHCILGLTTEQKLLINPPWGQREADSSRPDPIQSPLKSVQTPSAPVGLGQGPRRALSQLCCQNAKSFSIGFASLVLIHVWRSLGRGGGFWGFFFLNWGMISPLPACGLCAKEQERGQEMIFWSHQLPVATSQWRVDVSITGTPRSLGRGKSPLSAAEGQIWSHGWVWVQSPARQTWLKLEEAW